MLSSPVASNQQGRVVGSQKEAAENLTASFVSLHSIFPFLLLLSAVIQVSVPCREERPHAWL